MSLLNILGLQFPNAIWRSSKGVNTSQTFNIMQSTQDPKPLCHPPKHLCCTKASGHAHRICIFYLGLRDEAMSLVIEDPHNPYQIICQTIILASKCSSLLSLILYLSYILGYKTFVSCTVFDIAKNRFLYKHLQLNILHL